MINEDFAEDFKIITLSLEMKRKIRLLVFCRSNFTESVCESYFQTVVKSKFGQAKFIENF